MAPEFVKPPPAEMRREPELVIAQEPVAYLLRGHSNPYIRAFVNCYLRSLKEKQEDVRDEMEVEKLIREDLRDQAAIERLYAQMEGLHRYARDYGLMQEHLQNAEYYTAMARVHTGKLLNLFEVGKNVRLTLRGFNKFFTAIMEGHIVPGQEAFSEFLIGRVHGSSAVPPKLVRVLELYISLMYGDPRTQREIPFDFAKTHQFLIGTVSLIQQAAEEEARREREAFLQKVWESCHNERRKSEARQQKERQERHEKVLKKTSPFNLNFRILAEQDAPFYDDHYYLPGDNLVLKYMVLHEYSSVAKIFEPYYTARFAPPWKERFPNCAQTASWMLDWARFFRERSVEALKFFDYYSIPIKVV